jgi:hypothetical protein
MAFGLGRIFLAGQQSNKKPGQDSELTSLGSVGVRLIEYVYVGQWYN